MKQQRLSDQQSTHNKGENAAKRTGLGCAGPSRDSSTLVAGSTATSPLSYAAAVCASQGDVQAQAGSATKQSTVSELGASEPASGVASVSEGEIHDDTNSFDHLERRPDAVVSNAGKQSQDAENAYNTGRETAAGSHAQADPSPAAAAVCDSEEESVVQNDERPHAPEATQSRVSGVSVVAKSQVSLVTGSADDSSCAGRF